jgi:hypothetical protein
MKTILKLAHACVVLGLAMSAHAALTLYATGGGSGPGAQLSALYAINPKTGAASLVCQLTNNIAVYGGGLAYDAATDTLFATGTDYASVETVFSINRFTGAETVIGHPNPNGPAGGNYSSGGLAINPLTGIMYSTVINAGPNYALCTISKTTGDATLIGQFTGSYTGLYGLGFRDDGVLFGNGFSEPSLTSTLFTVDTATAASTVIGPHGVTLGRRLLYSGLAFGPDGTLYSLGSTSASAQGLYSVNPATGAATLIGDTIIGFGVDGGLTFAPGPEPIFAGISLSGTNLVINGSNGLAGRTYQVLASTNVALPVSQWLPVTTNILNASGNFTLTATNVVNPGFPQRFFILQLQ